MIDYEKIIEELDDNKVGALLDKLEIPFVDKGSFFILPTVCHHDNVEEASQKLYYYKNTHIFQCFTECGAMSIFSFLKHFYEARNYEYDWYEDIHQAIINCSNISLSFSFTPSYKSIASNYAEKKIRKELPSYPEGLLEVFTTYYPVEWLNDGITKETMDKFNIRYSSTQNKIIIPHYDVHNNLVGIRGRALNQWEIENIGKYMPVQIENQWYNHPLSLNLYGLNITKENIRRTGIAYIFEAEKSVLQMDSFSIPNCGVAVCGNKLNKFALDILIRECHPNEIVICFDSEELPKSNKYFNYLYNIGKKYQRYGDFSFIYDREHLLQLKDSPTDRGQEIFEKLLKKRVKVL